MGGNSPIQEKRNLSFSVHLLFYNRCFYNSKSLRKHHSLSKIKLSYENQEEIPYYLESEQQRHYSSVPVYNFSTTKFPCQILLNKLLNTSTILLRNNNNSRIKTMSAAKVRVHNTSTSSIDAVV